MESKGIFQSTSISNGLVGLVSAVALIVAGLTGDDPEQLKVLGTAGLGVVMGALNLINIIRRFINGRNPETADAPIRIPLTGKVGAAGVGAMVWALLAGILLLGVALSGCSGLSQQQRENAIQVGVTGGVSWSCDMLEALLPDNEWVALGCKAGEIVAVGVLAATLGLDGDDVASKAASVDLFDPGASPTLHMGCGAMALACHRRGDVSEAVADACAYHLAECEVGRSSVAPVLAE